MQTQGNTKLAEWLDWIATEIRYGTHPDPSLIGACRIRASELRGEKPRECPGMLPGAASCVLRGEVSS